MQLSDHFSLNFHAFSDSRWSEIQIKNDARSPEMDLLWEGGFTFPNQAFKFNSIAEMTEVSLNSCSLPFWVNL